MTLFHNINVASFVSHDFVTVETADDLIKSLPELTACIDAIDGMYEKTALILACVNHSVPIVTCGGAAGRMDPTQIVINDLTKVSEDRLLFHCRKTLRQNHGFPKVEMLRLTIPRRVYTYNHMDYIAAAMKNVFDRRFEIKNGYQIFREAPIMRHFTVELEKI